jgi:hypothetical protein
MPSEPAKYGLKKISTRTVSCGAGPKEWRVVFFSAPISTSSRIQLMSGALQKKERALSKPDIINIFFHQSN